jgi:hypothetical protein
MAERQEARWHPGILIAGGISVLLLLGAVVERWPYGYYTLMRLVVCGTALYLAFLAYEDHAIGWAIALSLTGLLFNPVLPVRLRRTDWQPFDVGAAVVIGVAAWRFRRATAAGGGRQRDR